MPEKIKTFVYFLVDKVKKRKINKNLNTEYA